MPFISEEIWHLAEMNKESEFIAQAEWPKGGTVDASLLADFEKMKEVVSGIRNIRNERNIPKKDILEVQAKSSDFGFYQKYQDLLEVLSGSKLLGEANEKPESASGFISKGDEIFVLLADFVDPEEEKKKLEKELEYMEGFLRGVDKKLSNEKFVSGAPAQVVENEKKKKEDALEKIQAIKESLAVL